MKNIHWNKIDSKILAYGGEWEHVASSIRSRLFGHMVILADDRIKFYKSDLYHDALWIEEYITGPIYFDWIVGEFGTYIGDIVKEMKVKGQRGDIMYRLEIKHDDGQWLLDINEADPKGPSEITHIHETLNDASEEKNISENSSEDIAKKDVESIQRCYTHTFVTIDKCGCAPDPSLTANDVHIIPTMTLGPREFGPIEFKADALEKTENETEYWTQERITEANDRIEAWAKMGYKRLDPIIPTLRNETNGKQDAVTRKVWNMESIVRELRDKLEEAQSVREEAVEAKSDISSVIDDIDIYIDEVETLINSLDDLPSLDIDLDVNLSYES